MLSRISAPSSRRSISAALLGNALIGNEIIVVVVGRAHRQPLDDPRRKLAAPAAILLLGVTLDELLVDVRADQHDGQFLQIVRLRYAGALDLLPNVALCLLGCAHASQAVEGVRVEWEIIQLALVVGNRAVDEGLHAAEALHIGPYRFVGGVEDVRAVLMHLNAVLLARIDVAADMAALSNQTVLSTTRACCANVAPYKPPPTIKKLYIFLLLYGRNVLICYANDI